MDISGAWNLIAAAIPVLTFIGLVWQWLDAWRARRHFEAMRAPKFEIEFPEDGREDEMRRVLIRCRNVAAEPLRILRVKIVKPRGWMIQGNTPQPSRSLAVDWTAPAAGSSFTQWPVGPSPVVGTLFAPPGKRWWRFAARRSVSELSIISICVTCQFSHSSHRLIRSVAPNTTTVRNDR